MSRSVRFRRLGLLNVISLLLMVLAACAAPAGAPAAEGEADVPAAADGEQVTIRFVTNHAEVELPFFEQVVTEFEAANPNIDIDFLNIAGDQFNDAIRTQAIGENLPDIWYARTFLTSDYASKGWTLNLTQLAERDGIDIEDFWPAQVAQMQYENELYALPYDFSNIGIYYNKDMFDEMGVPYPSDDWTWEDLAATAEQFVEQDADGTVTRWGLNIYPWTWVWLGLLQANGGSIFNEDFSACTIDSPENLATLEFFQDLRSRGIYPESGATPAGLDPFANGLVAMAFQGSWATQQIRDSVGDAFEFDVAAMPAGTSGRRGITPAGGAWAIAANSEHPDEAWEFLKFLTSTESINTLISDNLRSIPGRQSSVERWVEVASQGDLPPANVGIFADMMGDAYEIVYPPFWGDYDIAWNNLIVPAIVGGDGVLGPAEALAAMQEQCNNAIAAAR